MKKGFILGIIVSLSLLTTQIHAQVIHHSDCNIRVADYNYLFFKLSTPLANVLNRQTQHSKLVRTWIEQILPLYRQSDFNSIIREQLEFKGYKVNPIQTSEMDTMIDQLTKKTEEIDFKHANVNYLEGSNQPVLSEYLDFRLNLNLGLSKKRFFTKKEMEIDISLHEIKVIEGKGETNRLFTQYLKKEQTLRMTASDVERGLNKLLIKLPRCQIE